MVPAAKLRNKRVLVTGAAGFIGTHLVEHLLKQGARVTALVRYTSSGTIGGLIRIPARSRSRLKVVFGDIRDPDICGLAVGKNQLVMHLAAQIAIPYSYIAPRDFLQVNALGTTNLLAAAKDAGVERFLHVSTSEVYGTAQYTPIDEKHPPDCQSPYAASKLAADKMVLTFNLSHDLPVTIVRPFNCYGPGQSARAIIPTIILQALRGRTIRLGNLQTRRDMSYVTDIIEGMTNMAVSNKTIGRTVNLATGRSYSIGEMTALIGELLEKKLIVKTEKRRYRPAGSEVDLLEGDSRLAVELIGYKPKHSLRAGLKKTITFYKNNLAHYGQENYQI